jgi:hypothetical protein
MDSVERNRSRFIEKAARAYLAGLEQRQRKLRHLQILNAHSRNLNAGAADVLGYQARA